MKEISNRILCSEVNILNGTLQGKINFRPGLNIISGENGTLKTQLLQSLRNNYGELLNPWQPLRVQAVSPKRNSERRAVESIIQSFRQQNKTWELNLGERAGNQINGSGFDNYPSLGDLYYLLFDHRCKDGSDRKVHMHKISDEFNEVIRAVFPHYSLIAEWSEQLGAPKIRMQKNKNVDFPIESLSMGEQEVLSLILSVKTSSDDVDVYLIDEPEVHLNWSLEDRLFSFLDDFCDAQNKQAIVVTHSRTIFKPSFLPKVQFLSWNDEQKIVIGPTLSREQRVKLAGDAIEIIALGDFSKVTMFVEDSSHSVILKAIGELKNVEISTSECGNSPNVKSLYKHQKNVGPWANSYFLIDGDNEGNPFPGDPAFIHLPYYCIENMLLYPEILAVTASRSVKEVRQVMIDVIRIKKGAIFKKNKFFEFMADSLDDDHMTFERLRVFDGSIIVKGVVEKLALGSVQDMVKKYFTFAEELCLLDKIVPGSLLQALTSATPKTAVEMVSGTISPR